MLTLFEGFDFGLLDDPAFLEDSVREELVVPLLAALGYSASPPHRIVRSRPLTHPFVHIGTVRKTISIIPDYLLQRDCENAWVLDAKGPGEIIDSGKNVEQAYSYAIHKDVRVPLYSLCNGRRLIVYHVSHWPAVLDVAMEDICQRWPELLALLGTKAAWPHGVPPGFRADFGLALRKAGLDRDQDGQKLYQIFLSFRAHTISRVADDLYSVTGPYDQEHADGVTTDLMLTFDCDPAVYAMFLSALPLKLREGVRLGLTRQPYRLFLPEAETPLVTVVADPGDTVHTNENESYCPFIAQEFVPEPPSLE